MGDSKWTPEQREAISARGCSLLVAAAAGAGKTAVLVERIIRRITDETDPVDVDKLLVVTFTKAAAAEMRERISSAITAELTAKPHSRHLSRQLTLLNRASITTIHSFCLDILKQYFHKIDLDPVFRVADETETALLRLETLEEMFEDFYAHENQDFFHLVDAFGGDRDDVFLQGTVLKLLDFARSNPWPEEWLKNLPENYNCTEGVPLEELPWGRTILDFVSIQLAGCRSRLERGLVKASSPGGPASYIENLVHDLAIVDDLIRAVSISWEEAYTVFSGIELIKLNSCRDKNVDEQLKQGVKNLRDEVKKALTNIKKDYFSRPSGELLADLKLVAPMARTLSELTLEFGSRYQKAKTEKSILDFSDLEHLCLKALLDEGSAPGRLIPSQAACELREHFIEVLVDEYQDINDVQESILQLVSRDDYSGPNLFMVGDVKQSIYRFRLAEPSLFMKKYAEYPRDKGGLSLGIDLSVNFRSRREVVDTVNYIFRQLMTGGLSEIKYDAKAELVFGADYPEEPADNGPVKNPGTTEIYLLDRLEDAMPGAEHGEIDAVQREARLIANRIRKMVSGDEEHPGPEFYINDRKMGCPRPVSYRDIVVLLRTTKSTVNTFLEEFRAAGLPAFADTGTGYFEATEVHTMMSLLKIIDNPRQDIPLAAVLRSPVAGLDAGELAEIRLCDTEGGFYDAIIRFAVMYLAGNISGETGKKVSGFLAKLDSWRTIARQGTLSELVWRLYNETDFYAYVGGLPGGSDRQANLRSLYHKARQFESAGFRGLFRFLRFYERFLDTGSDLGTARALGENEDVVRVLSIHKSKGLEFPVVFVAGLGKQFNFTDLTQRFQVHKELGLGLPVVDLDLRLVYPSIAQSAVKRKLHLELLAEEMRILYVALTRAREKLILAGSARDLKRSAEKWGENVPLKGWPLPETELVQAKSYLDWIGPAIMRHTDGAPLIIYAGEIDKSLFLIPETSLANPELLESVKEFKQVDKGGGHLDTLSRQLNWQYPFRNLAAKPAKSSVTELKRLFAGDLAGEETNILYSSRPVTRPQFLQQSTGLSAAERGTAMHTVMQHLDLGSEINVETVSSQLNRLVDREIISAEAAGSVDIRSITAFFESDLGQRMLKAENVRSEVPFTMAVPVSIVYSDLEGCEDEMLLVQGVIDCLLDEGDGVVIIDYKTDRVSAGETEEAAGNYRGQLNLYASAVEDILRKPVKEKYLYFFVPGVEIKCC
ncbi:MAG: helicase-exonuclease AddAB subunit AddA [Firmicutes bacterium HGW-Firmicutes-14]|nr:MAG: helicase-exonuclease AddAB subunit AddA [Firmicutes bacterium HGW-Firmicutes-14]